MHLRYVSPVLAGLILAALAFSGLPLKAVRGLSSQIPVVEGGPAKRGEPTALVPGGPGSQRISPSQSPREGLPALGLAQTVVDDFGRPFPLPARTPERIVSMAPNITEILFALGLGDRVVGVTRFCDFPPPAGAIRRIGGLVDPSMEVVRSLDPDLVVAFRGNPRRLVERMGKLGLPVFVCDIGEGLEALFPLIERIGRITRTEGRAAGLAADLRRRLEAVDAALKDVAARPKVFVLLHGQGLWTCGGESYVDDLIARAGGTNVASYLPKKWALYKRERIIEDDPDVVFILARSPGDFGSARDWLLRSAGMGGVAAVTSGRIHALDENAASRFGPRLVDVLDRVARLLHPERFGVTG